MQLVKSNLLLFTVTNRSETFVSDQNSQNRGTAVELQTGGVDTLDRKRLEERRGEVQRHVRCVGRAVRLMLLLSAIALVGLCYSTVLIPDWPQTMRQFLMYWPVKAHCALGCASLTCAFLYFGLGLIYRRELTWIAAECRRLAAEVTLAETPRVIPLANYAAQESESPMQDAA